MLRIAPCLIIFLSVLHMSPAEACQPPLPGVTGSIPESGTVPSNAQIALIAFGEPMVLWSQEDFSIPGTTHTELLTWFASIEPHMLRGVTHFWASVEDGVDVHQTQFTISNAVDDVPPVFDADLLELEFEWLDGEPGLCQREGFHLTGRFQAATDDWGVTGYGLVEVFPNDAIVTVGRSLNQNGGPLTIYGYAGTAEGTRCFGVIARDWAGNVTPSFVGAHLKCIELSKEPPAPDAGTMADVGFAQDATAPTDAGTTPQPDAMSGDTEPRAGSLRLEREAGCGCNAARAATGSAWPLLLLLVLRRRVPNDRGEKKTGPEGPWVNRSGC